jgi:hypothetical protein
MTKKGSDTSPNSKAVVPELLRKRRRHDRPVLRVAPFIAALLMMQREELCRKTINSE